MFFNAKQTYWSNSLPCKNKKNKTIGIQVDLKSPWCLAIDNLLSAIFSIFFPYFQAISICLTFCFEKDFASEAIWIDS